MYIFIHIFIFRVLRRALPSTTRSLRGYQAAFLRKAFPTSGSGLGILFLILFSTAYNFVLMQSCCLLKYLFFNAGARTLKNDIYRPLGSDCGIVNVNIPTSGAEIGGAFGFLPKTLSMCMYCFSIIFLLFFAHHTHVHNIIKIILYKFILSNIEYN